MALWRIGSKKTDLVLTCNLPVKESPEMGEDEAKRVFEEAVESLVIKDYGLFAGGQEE